MDSQEIKGEDYSVRYDSDSTTVSFQGQLSLGGPAEYKPISQLLNDVVADEDTSKITLNLRELEFLNSSGISMLSKFVVGCRKKKNMQLSILGSKTISWQGKSLKNLTKLLPSLELELE